MGEPRWGETPYWESPEWPSAMATLLRWLALGS